MSKKTGMKRKLFLALLVWMMAVNAFGQSGKDSVIYDTIPARFLIYEDHCDLCPLLMEVGYVVYQNIAHYEKAKIHPQPLPDGIYSKDSSVTIIWYFREPQRVEINPYLRKNKLPMWMDYMVWDFKLDRPCYLNRPRGL